MDLFAQVFGRLAVLGCVCLGLGGCAGSAPLSGEEAWEQFSSERRSDFSVRYSERDLVADVYLPPRDRYGSEAGKPVLILIHGGGWRGGSPDLLAPHSRYFSALGWVCVNIEYGLAKKGVSTLVDAEADIVAAWNWVVEEGAVRKWDLDRVAAIGESSGGQLACVLGILPSGGKSRVEKLVLANPVLDLKPLKWTRSIWEESGTEADLHSPLRHLRAGIPKLLVIHGERDATVPVAQAIEFERLGTEAGALVELRALDGVEHAFLLEGRLEESQQKAILEDVVRFLRP